MPILNIRTNQDIDAERCRELLHKATDMLSTMLGKPKSAIMVDITPNAHLMLADSTAPSAYLELKLFAFPDEGVAEYVKALTAFVEAELGASPEFQFQQFITMSPSMFGWNGGTC